MNKAEKQQSKTITDRLHELEEIMLGKTKGLSRLSCGLCFCEGIGAFFSQETDCICPLNNCKAGRAIERREQLFLGTSIHTRMNLKYLAKEHYAFLIENLHKNGWEYK